LIPFTSSGATARGIDYSPRMVQMGREFGIEMHQGGLEVLDGVHDIVIMNHVLEHMLDPIESLRRASEHLSESGLIYIGVPNIRNFNMGQLQNAHTYYFTPKSLNYVTSMAKLSRVESGESEKIHMFGIFRKSRGETDSIDLSDHYKEMLRVIRFRRIRECIAGLLRTMHLYKPVKAMQKIMIGMQQADFT